MIRFKEKEFQQWSICPATGDIFDAETGEVQRAVIHVNGRPFFKNMPVHCIMAHTFLGGYKPGFDIHHKDENKLNNALSNLVYLTRAKHRRLHAGELLHEETRLKRSATMKGKPCSEETRAKISTTLKGKPRSEEIRAKISATKKGKPGKPLSEETRAKMSAIHKGKHLSEETRLKISEGLKALKRKSKTSLEMRG